MPRANIATLLSESTCDACNGPSEYSLLLEQVGLLKQIALALDPMATVDPASLLAQANCVMCYAPSIYALQAMNTVLLNQIAAGISTIIAPGVDFLLTGVVDPNGGAVTPPDTAKVWRYTNTATGSEWVWPANAPDWQQVV